MKPNHVFIIIIIIVVIGYIHQYIHKKISTRDDINIEDPYKHDIYKQATVDFTTIVFLYLIYNRDDLNFGTFIVHMMVASFGFFVFYHIIQPYIVSLSNIKKN